MAQTSKICELKTALTESLKSVPTACLLWSGGADSSLLLYVLREMQAPVDLLQFNATWTIDQKALINQTIKKLDLRVFAYQPANSYLIGQEAELSLVEEYAVGRSNQTIPILRDVVEGSRCALETGYRQFNQTPPIVFDLYLTGARSADDHYAMNGRLCPNKSVPLTGARLFSPLFEWTRAEVLEALKIYEPDYQEPTDALNTGNLPICSLCLRGERQVFCPKQQQLIDGVQWQPTEMLAAFRAKYGVVRNLQMESVTAVREL